MPDVRLRIDSVDYSGWTRVRMVRSIETIAGTFELGITDRWPESEGRRPIRPGQSCAVLLEGEPVIGGYVDEVEPRYDAQTREVTVHGRDATGDLVDCSAEPPGAWKAGYDVLTLIRALCKPFDIDVRTSGSERAGAGLDLGLLHAPFEITSGEAVFDALERLARMHALLLVSDGLGGLVVTRAGTHSVATVLQRGANILRCDATSSAKGLFSLYTVRGQKPDPASVLGRALVEPQGTADDETVGRYRPLVVVAEEPVDIATCRQRAEWERAVRVGRSLRIAVTVQGWTHADGLWQPNTRVHLRDDWLGMDAELLISQVSYLLDEGGTRTELELTRPEAYNLVPISEADKDKNQLAGWVTP